MIWCAGMVNCIVRESLTISVIQNTEPGPSIPPGTALVEYDAYSPGAPEGQTIPVVYLMWCTSAFRSRITLGHKCPARSPDVHR